MKVLLLGDSIRMGYCGFVRELCQGKDEVFYPDDNCRFLQYTLRCLQDWKAELLPAGDADVVHWNNGLWDVGHLGMGLSGEAEALTAAGGAGKCEYEAENLTPPFMYEYMLERVHRRIRMFFPHAKIIFGLTTPVQEDQAPPALYRSNSEVREYNEIARRVLGPSGVLFNDLYSFAEANLKDRYRDWVHFDDEGSRMLAEKIVEFIKA